MDRLNQSLIQSQTQKILLDLGHVKNEFENFLGTERPAQTSNPIMREYQEQAGHDWYYGVTKQMDGMTHLLSIALDKRLQFFDFFRSNLALDKTIRSVSNRQYAQN